MCPDRVVSHVKRSFGINNLYLPSEMVKKINTIRSVEAEFIDHNDPSRPLFSGMFDDHIFSFHSTSYNLLTLFQ